MRVSRWSNIQNLYVLIKFLPQKVDFWGKKVAIYSKWRSNKEWHSICADTVNTKKVKKKIEKGRYKKPLRAYSGLKICKENAAGVVALK